MQEKKFESRKQEYLYQLLDRLRTDCEYYLGNGNHHPQALWAGNEQGQIDKMREIWNQLEEKPEWLTWEDINDYAAKMGVEDLPSTKDGTAEKEIQDMLDRNYEREKKVGLEEADISTNSTSENLEKEKEEVEQQLKDVEELQAKKKELDDKVDELFEENKNIKEIKTAREVFNDSIADNSWFNSWVKNAKIVMETDNYILVVYKSKEDIRLGVVSSQNPFSSAINIEITDDFKGKCVKATVNWSAIGSRPADETLEFAKLLKEAGDFCKQIEGKDFSSKLNENLSLKTEVKKGQIINVIYNDKNGNQKNTHFLCDKEYDIDGEQIRVAIKSMDRDIFEIVELFENKGIETESQVSNYTFEQIGACLKDKGNDFKLQIQGSDTKTNWLNIDKEDLQKIYNTLSYKKKKTEDLKQDLGIEFGSDEESKLNELTARNLKDEFNSLTKEEQKAYLDLVPENLGPVSVNLLNKIAEHDGLDKDILYWVVNIKGGKIEESKIEQFVEFDVTIWHNDVNQRRILNTLSDIIYDNAGELLDTSNMEIINFDKTKYTLQVKIDKNITEKQLDEKISDGIYDIGAEVDDISEYREIQPKTIIKESKDNSFPSSDFSSEKLSYSDLDELISTFSKFKKFITPKQEKWLIENGFSVNELYEGLKEILSTFKSSAFKEIISIDEYIEEINNI